MAVVHNGIIENFRELREQLTKRGSKFVSETDTEAVAHLVTQELKSGKSPEDAVAASLKQLRGAFALAFLFTGKDDLLIGARKGSPLAIGYGKGEMYLGFDAIALAPFTNTISYLEDGDWVVLTRKGADVRDEQGRKVERPIVKSTSMKSTTLAEISSSTVFDRSRVEAPRPCTLVYRDCRRMTCTRASDAVASGRPWSWDPPSRAPPAMPGIGVFLQGGARVCCVGDLLRSGKLTPCIASR